VIQKYEDIATQAIGCAQEAASLYSEKVEADNMNQYYADTFNFINKILTEPVDKKPEA